MELCWLTTEKCNQNCRYCDRFLESADLSADEYHKILGKLIRYGVKQLTFGGGESLLVPSFDQIVKDASESGIHLKLVTNGKLIPEHVGLIPYFDEITLSIDSADPVTNEKLGRGYDHYSNVCRAIDVIRKADPHLQININTVVTKINFDQVIGMKDSISQWNVRQWRIFRFCPLRGTAVRNRDEFEISGERFQEVRKAIEGMNLECRVQFRDYIDMEQRYLLINPEGKLCISRGMKDMVVGNMIRDDLEKYFISSAV